MSLLQPLLLLAAATAAAAAIQTRGAWVTTPLLLL
jgi:hypothetical protein